MSNTRDNSPELDYFELRRRHEEYKNRARATQNLEKAAAAEAKREPAFTEVPHPAAQEEEILRPSAEEAEPELDIAFEDVPMDAFEEAIEEGYEDDGEDDYLDEEGDYEDGELENANPNPFDPFIRFFHGVKENISSRRGGKQAVEDEEDDFEGFDDLDEGDEAEPAASRPAPRRPVHNEDDEESIFEDEADAAMDIEEGESFIPVRVSREDGDPDDEDYEDDEDIEEDDVPEKGGFRKFMSLFVTRVDDEEDGDYEDGEDEEDEYLGFDEDGDDDDVEIIDAGEDEESDQDTEDDESDDEDAYQASAVRRRLFSLPIGKGRNKSRRIVEDDDFGTEFIRSIHGNAEGGQEMDEMNRPAAEAAQQSAGAAQEVGMSRRERRELAMRLAAEEAARKAAEEAARAAEEERVKAEANTAIEPLFNDIVEEPVKVDMAAFEDAPEVDVLVETTAEDQETIDEPTREFKPVSMRDVQEANEKALFTADEDEDEEDDEEEEIVEKKPRRGLFGRKRAKVEDEDEDDEDEDDEYDDEDEDEDLEEKPRRGLFGRKRAKVEDEDEDDEDEDDEYDDEDEDDEEYDEYDDDEDDDEYDDEDDDDYDEYDDDEPRRSFGHHLIGVIKVILGIILVLLIVVIGFNFHYYITGENAVLAKVHNMLGDSGASDVLCFGYNMREALPAPAVQEPAAALEPEIKLEPTAIPQPESTTAIPNLDNNGSITETPIVDAAPVVEQSTVVVQEPVVESAPITSGAIG